MKSKDKPKPARQALRDVDGIRDAVESAIELAKVGASWSETGEGTEARSSWYLREWANDVDAREMRAVHAKER